MNTSKLGASIYYASDKNIFDALNQSKVDNETVHGMFERRNIVCSKRTPREALAKYFSSLTHDYLDHQDIAARLGVVTRRERTTSIDVSSEISQDQLINATENLIAALRRQGDIVYVSKDSGSLVINIKYSEIDYRRSEFRQLQHRDGQIEIVKESSGFVFRSTQSEHINDARDELIRKLECETKSAIEVSVVTLFDFRSPKIRSKFFYDLMNGLAGYVRNDVTDVYVHKFKIGTLLTIAESNAETDTDSDDGDIQKILMKGSSVTRSALLGDLLKDEKYYIFRVGWLAIEQLGQGYGYAIEAMFHDPENCEGFSYLLKGVFPVENGKLSKNRRTPSKSEAESIAKSVEASARKLMHNLRTPPAAPTELEVPDGKI
jgi:hypothetical protein